MKQRVLLFIKKETVLLAAAILAVISAFFVPPSADYLTYIDWRVLGILFSLMAVMAGLKKNGVFDRLGRKLLQKTKNTLQLVLVLVFLCFFCSMLITNDVSLITFVPFAVFTLQKCGQERLTIMVVVMQTLAANLGSMFTPIGNPQNLYLYQLSGMEMGEFLGVMLPYTAASGALILLVILVLGAGKQKIVIDFSGENEENFSDNKKQNIAYLMLFFVCLLVVVRILPFPVAVAAVALTVAVMQREVFREIDYSLLLTFACFFVFTGNMEHLPSVYAFLEQMVNGHELLAGVLVSQAISNVPAALLLSEFTANYRALLVGVNIGGLGTLIASMASLISYKIYAGSYNRTKGKYLLYFTIANICFLAVLLLLAYLL